MSRQLDVAGDDFLNSTVTRDPFGGRRVIFASCMLQN